MELAHLTLASILFERDRGVCKIPPTGHVEPGHIIYFTTSRT